MRVLTYSLTALTMMATVATAQVRLPSIPLPTQGLNVTRPLDAVETQSLDRLSDLRHLAIDRLIRANPRLVDQDPNGEPVVRREILSLSPTEAALERARSLGFSVNREQILAGMNLRLVVFEAPSGMSTRKALRILREADPGGSYDYNHIYTGGGEVYGGGEVSRGAPTIDTPGRDTQSRVRIGLLDTGIDITHPVFRDSVMHSWGCDDRPVPAAHGTAVASLLIGRSEVFQGVRPNAELYA